MEWPKFEKRGEVAYGGFHGGDPRDFRPDVDDCADDEIARWYRACVAASRLEVEGRLAEAMRPPGCWWLGDNATKSGDGFGIGVCLFPSTPRTS